MSFRKLKNFPSQKAKYEQFKKWEDMTPLERQKAYAAITTEANRAKPLRVEGSLSLFNTLGAQRIFLPAKILSPDWSTGQGFDVGNIVRDLVAPYVVTPEEFKGLVNPIRIAKSNGIKFAKIALKKSVPSITPKESRITGSQYKKPDVDTISSPFGQSAPNEDFDVAVTAIRGNNKLANFLGTTGQRNTVKFTPEGI